MCLDTITGKPEKTEGWGWKCFGWATATRVGAYLYGTDLPRGKWVKAVPFLGVAGKEPYETGFHIEKSRRSARGWRSWQGEQVLKVQYRGAYLEGRQAGEPVVVASEIRIPTVEEWRLRD